MTRRILTVAGVLAFALWTALTPLSPVWDLAKSFIPVTESGQSVERLGVVQVRADQDLESEDNSPSPTVLPSRCSLKQPLPGGPALILYADVSFPGRHHGPTVPRSPPLTLS